MRSALLELSASCNRCGFCQEVCPTYRHSRNEIQVARGRIQMLRNLEENGWRPPLEKEALQQVDSCLLCRACVLNCPSAVATDRIVLQARRTILQAKGFSLFHLLVYRGLLTRQQRLKACAALLNLPAAAGAERLARRDSIRKAFEKLTYFADYLPSGRQRVARSQLKTTYYPQGRPVYRVAYFLGCATNVFCSSVAQATVQCLLKAGCKVDIPAASCCGGPHQGAGDIEAARRLALTNIRIFFKDHYDWIVSDCATCAHTLHTYGDLFASDDPVQETVAKAAGRVFEVAAFLETHCDLDRLQMKTNPHRATFHDPCHAVRGMRVRSQPRDLLTGAGAVELVEMQGADVCCGGAGNYCFRHPEMSGRILSAKIEAIRLTRARVVATTCPACILQLKAGVKRAGLQVQVSHPVELLCTGDSQRHER